MEGNELSFRVAQESEFCEIQEFVSSVDWLENYPKHVYKILLRYFGNTCFVAENERGDIQGFVLGFKSQKHEKTYFLWQIGIHSSQQNKGMGSWLLSRIETRLKNQNFKRVEVTVDPENIPSRKLFECLKYRNISKAEGKVVKMRGIKAIKDYYQPGRHFVLYEKKLE